MTDLNREGFREAASKGMPLVVDFWAGWCMPCRVYAPVVEEAADDLDGKADFGKVNIDDQRELALEYDIMSIPTLVVFKGGEEMERLVGVRKKEEIIEAVNRHL